MTYTVEAEIETSTSIVAVAAPLGSPGQLLPFVRATAGIELFVPAVAAPIEFRVGTAAWAALDAGQGIALPVDLSITTVALRKASPVAGAVPVRVVSSSLVGVSAGSRSALAAALAASNRSATLPLRRRWGVLGDSISAQAALTSGPTLRGWSANSYVTWLRRYLADVVELPTERVYAVANATVGQPRTDGQPAGNTVIDSQLQRAIADRIEVALVHMGTNSIGTVDTPTLLAQFAQVYDTLIAAGVFVVAVPIRVRGPSAQWNTAAKTQQFARVNRFIADYAFKRPAQMLCIDVNPALMDFSTGLSKAGLYLDDVHDNAPSAQLMGRAIADVVRPLLPPMDRRFMHLQDVYHPADNPGGNLIANGLFAGAGGNAAINGSTGQAATGWDVGRNNGNSTVTVAGAKAADATYAGLANQTVTFGGTADGQTSFLAYFFNDTSSFSPGDRVAFDVECIGGMTSAALGGITAVVDVQDAGYAGLAASYDGLYQAGFGGLPADIGSFVLRTEPLVLPAGFRFVTCRVQFQPVASGAISGKLTFRRAALRKISDTAPGTSPVSSSTASAATSGAAPTLGTMSTTGPAVQPLRFVSQLNSYPYGADAVGSSRKRVLSISPVTIGGGDVAQLVISMGTQYMSFATGNTSGYTIEEMWLERNSPNETRQLFFSGSPSKAVAAGDFDVQSDPLLPTAFSGSPTAFARGSTWTLRVQLLLNADSDTYPTAQGGGQAFQFNPATTAFPAASGTGGIGYTLNGGSDWAVSNPIAAMVLGRYASGDPLTILALGDSIVQGNGDNAGGFASRSFSQPDGSQSRAGCLSGASGAGAAVWTGDPSGGKRAHFLRYANAIIEEFGTNNSPGYPGSMSDAQSGSKAIWAMARAAGINRILRTKLTPRTNGSYGTEAAQSYVSGSAPGQFQDTFNAWLDTQVGQPTGPTALIDFRAFVAGVDPNKWATGMTDDGLHPNPQGAAAMAAATRAVLAAQT